MNVDKFRVMLLAIREAAAIVIAAIEDYVGTPYDQSMLAKRWRKIKSNG